MWLNSHPFLDNYLVGCTTAVVLTIAQVLLYELFYRVTRRTVAKVNIAKLRPDYEMFLGRRILRRAALSLPVILLSWIGGLLLLFEIPWALAKMTRQELKPVADDIKKLQLKLRNDPTMSREDVWAYVQALGVKLGRKVRDEETLALSLNEVISHHPFFNQQSALMTLKELDALSSQSIDSLLEKIKD